MTLKIPNYALKNIDTSQKSHRKDCQYYTNKNKTCKC